MKQLKKALSIILAKAVTNTESEVHAMWCCLCGKKFEGHGNNAMPLMAGKCCDECVHDVNVARIKEMSGCKEYLPRVLKRLSKERRDLGNGSNKL